MSPGPSDSDRRLERDMAKDANDFIDLNPSPRPKTRHTLAPEAILNFKNQDLQDENMRLNMELDALKDEHARILDRHRLIDRELRECRDDLKKSSAQCTTVTNINKQLGEEKKNHAKERADLTKCLKDAEIKYQELKHDSDSKLCELQAIVLHVTNAKADVDQKNIDLLAEHDHLLKKHEENRMLIQALQSHKEDYETQSIFLEQLKVDLEYYQEQNQSLRAQLEIITPPADGLTRADSKSLFSEEYDRRLELEENHRQLTGKHEGLLQAHHKTINQQHRLKNHITRLTQLTHQRQGDGRISQLEQALNQSESENKALLQRIAVLERQQHLPRDHGEVGDANSTADSNVIECIRLRSEQLSFENEQLKKDAITKNMMRLNETEKLRLAEVKLNQKLTELEKLQATFAQVKFELEDLRARANPDATAENGDSIPSAEIKESSSYVPLSPTTQADHPSQIDNTGDIVTSNRLNVGCQTDPILEPESRSYKPLNDELNSLQDTMSPSVDQSARRAMPLQMEANRAQAAQNLSRDHRSTSPELKLAPDLQTNTSATNLKRPRSPSCDHDTADRSNIQSSSNPRRRQEVGADLGSVRYLKLNNPATGNDHQKPADPEVPDGTRVPKPKEKRKKTQPGNNEENTAAKKKPIRINGDRPGECNQQ
ncbi:uncharacterized protein BJ171DRAFT_579552 [Polychytrium aggregatum]|uniref:uncharacterized protein n=1 Tax=Polychytrium aggregatum TaxID=110093 RepID=UPI0022FEBEB9|nr:uncharacterized protein BJ171DRAFT_579552 [Polychytrium aggregatum]KAI9206570.1 hypothetical protein BJ171DRAFT_579552 [Polychytrium aggregatum]